MKSIRTEQFNQPLAENHEEYHTLFINLNTADNMCPATVCFELTLDEIDQIAKTGKIYYQQCLFLKQVEIEGEVVNVPAHQFHPISIHVTNPLEPLPEVKETRGAKDVNYISDDPSEIRTDAKACGVDPFFIRFAKYVLQDNNRENICRFIKETKGHIVTLEVE